MAGKARIGLIGAGWWATANHLPILAARSDVELVGVCRLGKAELRAVAERFGFRFATEDYLELLDRVELDGVIVASPHALHYEHARAALERGIHVMVEKPMALRAEHARELVRLAAQKQRHLLVPYGWHYKPFIQFAWEQMRTRGVGTVEYVLCHMASPIRTMLTGRPRTRSDADGGAAGTALFKPDPRTWSDPAVAGGGYGHAQLTHATALLFLLTDLRPEEVFCWMTAPGARVDLHDAMTVKFGGGALGTVSGSAGVPENQKRFQVDIRVYGTEGMLLVDCERARAELHRADGSHTMPVAPDAGAYECSGPVHNFIDLILGRTERNWSPGTVACRSVELLDAAYRSAQSGRPEHVSSSR